MLLPAHCIFGTLPLDFGAAGCCPNIELRVAVADPVHMALLPMTVTSISSDDIRPRNQLGLLYYFWAHIEPQMRQSEQHIIAK